MSGHRSVIRDPGFLRLWAGTTASGLATWALPFILGLAIISGDLTAVDLGIALAARTIGFLVVLPVAGVLADRHSPIVVVRVSGLLAAAGTAPLAWSLGQSTAVLVASALTVGAGQGACRPAFQALVPLTVEPTQRQEANAAISVAVRTCVLVGPAAAGLASGLVGSTPLVLVTGALWALAALVPARPKRDELREAGSGFLPELVEGLREARRHPWFLGGLGALAVVIMTGYSVTAVALPMVSRDEGSGVLLAAAVTAYTVGALLGGVAIARLPLRSEGWIALAALASYALAPLALLTASPPLVIAAYLLAGIGIEFFNVPWFTAAQREVKPELLSRVSSFDFLVSYGLAPVGLAFIAPAIDAFGMQPVLIVCAIACAAGPALAALVPTSRRFGR